MKRLICLTLFLYSLSIGAQNIDSTTFDFNNPRVGDYITIRLVWGCQPYFRPGAAKIIEKYFVPVVKKYPSYIYQIEHHTDCRGSNTYNKLLSQRRADSLRTYIIVQGIDSNQIRAKGIGEDSLLIKKCKCDLSDNRNICSEFEHQLNRRTILRIIGKKEE